MHQRPSLHAEARRCGEISLNTFEERNPDEFSTSCGGDHCDAFSDVKRGSISKAFNVGLKSPLRKEMNVDTYNQGCVNPWGCVNNDGLLCVGSQEERRASWNFMREQYRDLNANYDPSLSELSPPSYSMGWKTGTVNSVTGWQRMPGSDRLVWQATSPTQVDCDPTKKTEEV